MNNVSQVLTASTNLTLPQQIARMDPDRLRTYRENLDFYNGIQWLGHSRHRERRLTFNYAKVFVDKVTSYMMSGLDFNVDVLSPDDKMIRRRHVERRMPCIRCMMPTTWSSLTLTPRSTPLSWATVATR